MKCIFCSGDMNDGVTTDFTDVGSCMIIIKNVPCMKCEQCGETVFVGAVFKRLEHIRDSLRGSFMEVAIIKYSESAA